MSNIRCKHSIQTFNANIQFEYSLHIMSTFINIGIPISPFSDFIPSLKLFVVEKGNGVRLLLCFPAERCTLAFQVKCYVTHSNLSSWKFKWIIACGRRTRALKCWRRCACKHSKFLVLEICFIVCNLFQTIFCALWQKRLFWSASIYCYSFLA